MWPNYGQRGRGRYRFGFDLNETQRFSVLGAFSSARGTVKDGRVGGEEFR